MIVSSTLLLRCESVCFIDDYSALHPVTVGSGSRDYLCVHFVNCAFYFRYTSGDCRIDIDSHMWEWRGNVLIICVQFLSHIIILSDINVHLVIV